VSDLWDKRIVGVRVGEHGANRQEYFRDGQSRAPLISENVETDASIGIDVGVVDAGSEVDFRRLERIVGRELDG